MAKDVRVRLSHMLDCIGWIEEDAAAATLEQLAVDRRLRQIVERNLEIISEASRHIPADLKDRFSSIPWREIAGIGNILRHNYEEIAPKIMFDLIRHDLFAEIAPGPGILEGRARHVKPRRYLRESDGAPGC